MYPQPPIRSIVHLCGYVSAGTQVRDERYEPSLVMYRPLRPFLFDNQGPTIGWDISPYIEGCYYHMLGVRRDERR